MQSNSYHSHSPHRYGLVNGVDILEAFRSMGNEATVDELENVLSENKGIPKVSIDPDVKLLLSNGIRSGLLVRDGQIYSVNRYDNQYDVDAHKRYKINANRAHTDSSASEVEEGRKEQPAFYKFGNQHRVSSQRKLPKILQLHGMNEDQDESACSDSAEDDEGTQFSDTSSEEEPRRKSFLMSKYNLK